MWTFLWGKTKKTGFSSKTLEKDFLKIQYSILMGKIWQTISLFDTVEHEYYHYSYKIATELRIWKLYAVKLEKTHF